MDCYPPPHSGIESVFHLLPGQTLSFDGEVVPRRRFPSPPSRRLGELLDLLQTRYTTELRNLGRAHSELALGLSGGSDSRLILAAGSSVGLTLRPFTFDLPGGMARGDRRHPCSAGRQASATDSSHPAGSTRTG